MSGDSFRLSCTAKAMRLASLSTIFIMLSIAAGTASGQELTAGSLDEAKAIEYALARPVIEQAEEARLLAAQSAVTESSLLPNPVVSITHDNAGAPGGRGSESTVMLSQTVDISGRRKLRQEAAQGRFLASRLDGDARRMTIVQDVRRVFAEALYQKQLQEAHTAWLQHIEAAVEVVTQLAKAGEASGYDRRRWLREAQSAQARLDAIEAEGSRKREILAGLIAKPLPALAVLEGDLIPDPPPPLETLLASTSTTPAIASLEARANAFEHDRQAAARLGVPDITVGLGTKHVTEPGFSDNGLMLALSLPIPIFDQGQAQEQEARAQAAALRAEHSLKLARLQAELRGLWQQTEQLREAALSYREEALSASHELSRIAEAAYRAGEGSLLELLDAYRAELDAQQMKLDLALQARLSRIELDSLTGASQYE